jgi:TP901 family phage tail tape measure protein
MAKLETLIIELRADNKKLKQDLNKVRGATNKQAKKMGSEFGKMFNTGLGSFAIGAGAIFALTSAVRKGIRALKDLDTGMRNVNTIIKVGEKQLKSYTKEVRKLSTQTGATTKELTDGFYQLVSAGVAAGDSIKFLGVASKAAIAGLSDTKTAIDGMTTIMNSWQMSAEDANDIFDTLFKTVELGKTTFGEIAASISMVAPLAAAVGVSFKEVSASVAHLTAQGTPTTVAMTQIASAINGMNTELGDGWTKTRTLQEAMEEMFKRAGGSAEKLLTMMGRKEGMLAVLASAGKNADAAGVKFKAMGESAGAGMAAFNEQTKSMEFKIKKLDTALTDLSVSIIDNFTGTLTWLVENFTGGLDIITGRALEARDRLIKDSILNQDIAAAWEQALEGMTTEALQAEMDLINDKWDELDEKITMVESVAGGEIPRTKKYREDLLRLETQALAVSNAINGISVIPTGGVTPSPKPIISGGTTPALSITPAARIGQSFGDRFDQAQDVETTRIAAQFQAGMFDDTTDELETGLIEASDGFNANILGGVQSFGNLLTSTLGLAADSFVGVLMDGISIVGQLLGIVSSFTPAGFIKGFLGGAKGGTFEGGQKVASFAGGGDFTVPQGFSNDSFPMMVQSGERVQVTPSNKVGDESKILAKVLSAIYAQTAEMGKLDNKITVINNANIETTVKNNKAVETRLSNTGNDFGV